MNENEYLVDFVKKFLITKRNGINATFSNNPNKFLLNKELPKNLIPLLNTKEKLIDFIYTQGIITPAECKISKCSICGNQTQFLGLPKGYREFCSYECFLKCDNRKQRVENGFMKAYGVKNCLILPHIREKAQNTLKKNHGVDACHLLRNDFSITQETKQKIKDTHAKRSFKEKELTTLKRKQTNLKRYNDEYCVRNESVKNKIKETFRKRYGKDNYTQTDEYKALVSGDNHFSREHIQNKENFNKEYMLKHFVKNKRFLIDECCVFFNVSESYINEFKRHNNIIIPNKRSNKALTQQRLYDEIDVENKILNSKAVIPPYEIDIFLPDFNLAIEYNGLMFHSLGKSEYPMLRDVEKDYHLKKTQMCEEKGIQLLHIFESDNIEIWKSLINSKIGKNTKIYARKCVLKDLKQTEINEFLENNHLQGSCEGSFRYGLFFNNVLVCVLLLEKTKNTEHDFELLRFCNLKGYNVIGGASKLLKHFRKHNNGSIISYANRRWSNGNLYEKLGFTKISYTMPEYFYFYEKDKKYKLQKNITLENFNPNLSEFENMFNQDYRVIFDCGNMVYLSV